MKRSVFRKVWLAGTIGTIILCSGCSNTVGDGWEKSGSDKNRGIDHYYLKKSVKPLNAECIRVKTKLIPHKGDTAVATAVNMEKAYAIETEGVIYCKDSAFMVLSKEYFDKQGISLKVEKDGGNMGAVREIKAGTPLYPMIQQVCKEVAATKPVQKQTSSAQLQCPTPPAKVPAAPAKKEKPSQKY